MLIRTFLRAGALGLCAGLIGCSSDDDDGSFNVTTIGASLNGLGLTTLATAVDAAELDDDLSQPGPFTLFAPTNAAFNDLPQGTLNDLLMPANQADLVSLLQYHVLTTEVDAMTAAGLSTATTLEGPDLILDTVGGDLYVNDARVTSADIEADNGIIHRIDSVLRPPTDIVTALEDRGFDDLLAALQATTLDATLSGPGPFTLLAPTDAAFADAAAALGGLTPTETSEVLLYHVIGGELRASDALMAGIVPSANTNTTVVVFGEDSSGVTVNNVTVPSFNIACTNGIIHVIDEVLVEPLDLPALADALGLETLVAALQAAELDDDLAEPNGPFTVFAPSEGAFADLPQGTLNDLLMPANQADLIALLQYHVLASEVDAASASLLTSATTLEGSDVLIDTIGGELYVNDALVERADIQAENGLAHAVDAVLMPPTDIVSALDDRGFSTLVQALSDAGLDGTLMGAGPFTVLAPTDAAFAALPAGTLAGLTMGELADLLQYHVISGSVRASDAIAGGTAPTLAGPDVFFAEDSGTVTVNGVTVSSFNIPSTNGVIHVLDAVLTEPAIPALASLQGLDTLVQALQAAELDDDLDEPNGPFTVFAPTETAFATLAPGQLTALLDPANQADLIQLLQYHVVPGALDSAAVLSVSMLTTLEGSDLSIAAGPPPTVDGNGFDQLDLLASNGFIHTIDGVLVPPGFTFPGPIAAAGVDEDSDFDFARAQPSSATDGLPLSLVAKNAATAVAGWSDPSAAGRTPLAGNLSGSTGEGLVLLAHGHGLRVDAAVDAVPSQVVVRLVGADVDAANVALFAADGAPYELFPGQRYAPANGELVLVWTPRYPATPTDGLDITIDGAAQLEALQVYLRN